MKKLLLVFVVVIVILLLGVFGFIWYIKPAETLNLDAKPFTIQDKIKEVVQSRKMEVKLTEQEINSLLKQQLQSYTRLPHDIRLTGANFDLQGQELIMDANVIWKDQIPASVQVYFHVLWNNGAIVVEHTWTKLKQWHLPKDWMNLQPITIPIANQLPKMVAIRDVVFEDDGIVFKFKLAL
ncbi:hypothetical protein NV379_21450 [Paenibacillus sp. N1-5-1-14]|uniref:hypothetical protein n=1 Tax=Paenibacillus radicibacter TaxID=2972488 RepID=UPI0021594F65|nr:hypothetical protein [Paenibacillus radicibacter]MCR8645225.1 hypothetical protein [Paenibacillus radicibacter]